MIEGYFGGLKFSIPEFLVVGKLGNYFFEWLDLSRDAFGPILNKTGSTPAGTFSFFICFSNKSPLNGLHTELR